MNNPIESILTYIMNGDEGNLAILPVTMCPLTRKKKVRIVRILFEINIIIYFF